MIPNSYINLLAEQIIKDYSNNFSQVVIVLPNKRAKIFLIEAIQAQIKQTVFCPEITNIEDFVQDIAQLRCIDSVEVLFEFYNVYLKTPEVINHQSFDVFANWAKTVLQDFNDIDKYLINPDYILTYLKDIEDIKRWGVTVENKTILLENYINFWKLLPTFYHALCKHLKDNKVGYQGMIYREALHNIDNFCTENASRKFIFAGFNALNKAEEKIIQHLVDENLAKTYWDLDAAFVTDTIHDAGLFLRRYKNHWKHYKSHPFEWIFSSFSEPKNIQIIGTPKLIGQAKIAANIISQICKDEPESNLDKVALVLGDENMLLPILHSLPQSVNNLNVTMGFSSKNNPIQLLITKLFKMHINAIKRSSGQYTFYYKEVLDILTHPYVQNIVQFESLIDKINSNNLTFFSFGKLIEIAEVKNDQFNLLFRPWNNSATEVLSTLLQIIEHIKKSLLAENDAISKVFLFAVYKTLNKLRSYFDKSPAIDDIETLFSIYKQVVELSDVSFEGEPLQGLQIMGVLESRVLDFETVIITNVNEGKFPAGKSHNSFIPYDVRRENELPTYKEKDAVYTYHFYHLLQRAKNIYLIYNTDSEGFDSGEKSRFITQLEVEKQPNHTITHQIFNAPIPEIAFEPIVIPKTEGVIQQLLNIAAIGFSPTSLTSYIRNPLAFYFEKVLKIKNVEEVEENIAINTLGTIIHESLETLLSPFIGIYLTEMHIKSCFDKVDTEVLNQFKLVYKEGEINKGKNLLAFEVAKRNINNYLKYELQTIQNGDIVKILHLEKVCERTLQHPNLIFPVKIGGKVDRIEERNGITRIIDYKTGKVEAKDLQLKSWDGLTLDIKNDKIVQLLAYAFMYQDNAKNTPLEVGIISFKNLKSGVLPFQFKSEGGMRSIIDNDILNNYISQLVILLNEIFDPSIPFAEKN